MIQRIIDWYNGYTLQEKLEWEALQEYVLFQLLKDIAEELNENIERYPIQPGFNSYEYGITNYKIIDSSLNITPLWNGMKPGNLYNNIKFSQEPGFSFRVKMKITGNKNGKKLQVWKEYCIEYLKKQMMLEKIKNY